MWLVIESDGLEPRNRRNLVEYVAASAPASDDGHADTLKILGLSEPADSWHKREKPSKDDIICGNRARRRNDGTVGGLLISSRQAFFFHLL